MRHILTFSRRQPLQRSVQDLRPIVEEALNILRATLPARVALDKRFADAAVHVLVDAIQIEQVVINLCTNAWQAMESHGGRIEIGVGTARLDAATATRLGLAKGMHAWMWFADDGAGMDDATRLRVFDPFFTTKPLGTGTGLGLSVVHGIVQSHDGAIGVESVLGKGSRFDLYLPLTKARPDDIAPNGPARTVASGHGECVLFIDDDEMMPLMVERLLERAGYAVRCFADPTTAVDAVRARPGDFDVVVTDYNMPKMSGLDVALALSSILPSLPIVLTSGLVTDELRTRARECGVLEVIDKQNSLEELAAAVQRALTLSAGKSPHA